MFVRDVLKGLFNTKIIILPTLVYTSAREISTLNLFRLNHERDTL